MDYYALDLSKPELQRTLSAVPEHYQYVRCHGLLGTYRDGLDWLKRPERQQEPQWILSLGSSIGNFGRDEAASFLREFANVIGRNDAVLVGLDACQDKDKVYHAYNDKQGKTHEFVLNGLLHANRLLGKDVFQLRDWKVIGEYDEAGGRHQAFYSPMKDVVVDGAFIEAGTRIRVEESYKYSSSQSNKLWRKAGLVQQACFGNSSNDYRKPPDFLRSIRIFVPLFAVRVLWPTVLGSVCFCQSLLFVPSVGEESQWPANLPLVLLAIISYGFPVIDPATRHPLNPYFHGMS